MLASKAAATAASKAAWRATRAARSTSTAREMGAETGRGVEEGEGRWRGGYETGVQTNRDALGLGQGLETETEAVVAAAAAVEEEDIKSKDGGESRDKSVTESTLVPGGEVGKYSGKAGHSASGSRKSEGDTG